MILHFLDHTDRLQPRTDDVAPPYRRPGFWITLGWIVYCIAFWIGVGLGIHTLVTVL